jgi:hypothetical protein
MWNLIFGSKDDYPLTDRDIKSDLFTTVKILVRFFLSFSQMPTLSLSFQIKRSISSWLHKFAVVAEKALSDEFETQGLTTTEERAEFVQYLLGDADDLLSKHRPFLWKSSYEPGGEDVDKPQVWIHQTMSFHR